MPEIGSSGLMSGDGKRGVGQAPSYRAHPRLYHLGRRRIRDVILSGQSRTPREHLVSIANDYSLADFTANDPPLRRSSAVYLIDTMSESHFCRS
jgi:hypothetical protein